MWRTTQACSASFTHPTPDQVKPQTRLVCQRAAIFALCPRADEPGTGHEIGLPLWQCYDALLHPSLLTLFASLCLSSSLIFHSRTAARLATFSTFSTPVHLHLCRGTEACVGSISSSPTSLSPLSMTFPSQDVPSSTTNSELLAAPTSSDYPRGSHINTNACSNSHSQLSLSSLKPPPSPFASTHSH